MEQINQDHGHIFLKFSSRPTFQGSSFLFPLSLISAGLNFCFEAGLHRWIIWQNIIEALEELDFCSWLP